MKSFVFGAIYVLISSGISLILKNEELFVKMTAIAGGGAFILSTYLMTCVNKDIFSNADVLDRYRSRSGNSASYFLFGLPSVLAFILYSAIFNFPIESIF